MIDLHLHTNASDGRCSPEDLVGRAVGAGLTVISVVDHDTVAAVPETTRLATAAGLRAIAGIEITSVVGGRDVHVLGYGFDVASPRLEHFLAVQRRSRIDRVHAILGRLAALGLPVPFDRVVERVEGRVPHSIGRPQIARAMVRAGYVPDSRTAFDEYLADDRPAFVPRSAPGPADVVRLIDSCGGVASLAHPGLTGRDDLVPGLVDAGLRAIEVYHPDHPGDIVEHYRRLAARLHLSQTGGSDFHGDDAHGEPRLGRITLPLDEFARFDARLRTNGR